jgi:hypothetical protein
MIFVKSMIIYVEKRKRKKGEITKLSSLIKIYHFKTLTLDPFVLHLVVHSSYLDVVTFLDEVLIQDLVVAHVHEMVILGVLLVLSEMVVHQNLDLDLVQVRIVVQSQVMCQVFQTEVRYLMAIRRVRLHLLGH